jgi:hypothetical protein
MSLTAHIASPSLLLRPRLRYRCGEGRHIAAVVPMGDPLERWARHPQHQRRPQKSGLLLTLEREPKSRPLRPIIGLCVCVSGWLSIRLASTHPGGVDENRRILHLAQKVCSNDPFGGFIQIAEDDEYIALLCQLVLIHPLDVDTKLLRIVLVDLFLIFSPA